MVYGKGNNGPAHDGAEPHTVSETATLKIAPLTHAIIEAAHAARWRCRRCGRQTVLTTCARSSVYLIILYIMGTRATHAPCFFPAAPIEGSTATDTTYN